MHEGYRKYLDVLKDKGLTNPMSEKQWREAVGIPDVEHIPFAARKTTSQEKGIPIPQNHEEPKPKRVKAPGAVKKPKPKKVKAPEGGKEPKPKKPKMTDEERRLRRNALKRERDEKRRREAGVKPKKILTEEERKAYKREYMAKWRKLHPRASYEANLKWRLEHPEENRRRRREEARRRRERLKNG